MWLEAENWLRNGILQKINAKYWVYQHFAMVLPFDGKEQYHSTSIFENN